MEQDIMVCKAPGRINLFGLTLIGLFFSCGTTDRGAPTYPLNITNSTIATKTGISSVNGKIIDGKVYALYFNGDTSMTGTYEQGKEQGELRYWYENKQLKEIRLYTLGKKEGKHQGWYEDGAIRFEYNYLNDNFHGEYKDWFRNGQLFRSWNFKNGHEDGAQQVRYETGQILSNYLIKNKRRYGLLGTENCINVADSIPR
jgi:antitoxin component YwqK of YwqJK toxin-antitoxin module